MKNSIFKNKFKVGACFLILGLVFFLTAGSPAEAVGGPSKSITNPAKNTLYVPDNGSNSIKIYRLLSSPPSSLTWQLDSTPSFDAGRG